MLATAALADLDVRGFGATGDGKTGNTAAFAPAKITNDSQGDVRIELNTEQPSAK
jgi:hypothetical protein